MQIFRYFLFLCYISYYYKNKYIKVFLFIQRFNYFISLLPSIFVSNTFFYMQLFDLRENHKNKIFCWQTMKGKKFGDHVQCSTSIKRLLRFYIIVATWDFPSAMSDKGKMQSCAEVSFEIKRYRSK